MYIKGSHISCGLHQLFYLNTRGEGIKNILTRSLQDATKAYKYAEKTFGGGCPLQVFKVNQSYVFSDADTYQNGVAVAKFIQDNNLGEVTEVGPWVNPNTGNVIRMWVWKYNGTLPTEWKGL